VGQMHRAPFDARIILFDFISNAYDTMPPIYVLDMFL
jgi:hypothetical protein